jgi:hypothetical protein
MVKVPACVTLVRQAFGWVEEGRFVPAAMPWVGRYLYLLDKAATASLRQISLIIRYLVDADLS